MAQIPGLDAFLTPALRAKAEQMKRERGLPTLGFYGDLMAHPELFARVEALGSFLRFHGLLPARIREAAILMAAVEQRSPFEWDTHQQTARAAGLVEDEITAIGSGAILPHDLEEVRVVVRSVVRGTSVLQEVFDSVAARLTLQGAVELVGLVAFYRMMAGLGAAFDSALPDAAPPPWSVP